MDTTSMPPMPAHLSPGKMAFLPLLYMAWSDDILTPGEIDLIEKKIAGIEDLSAKDKKWVCSHLDPNNPPTPVLLKKWLRLIQDAMRDLPEEKTANLINLSRTLADLGTEHLEGIYKDETAEEALRELEEALGWKTDEAVKEAFIDKDHLASSNPVYEASFDPQKLELILDGPYREIRQKMRVLLSDPFFSYDKTSPVKEEYREQVLVWLQELARQGFGSLAYPESSGGKHDMGTYIAVFEALGHHDLSLLVKFGVQFGLFGGSVYGLGKEYHYEHFLTPAGTLELPGCFAMTEANHGSNVRDLETTAVYDPASQEFIIHTPHYLAHKEYIGNAAAHAKVAVVFAQLETLGEQYGVHAIVVPIRDDEGNPLPGVTIADSGQKLGLNGVDNGRLWFDQVRVPRVNLLDKFGQVSDDGTYSSDITSEGRRFFTMLGTLVGGRVAVPMGGLSAVKSGLTIALQYAAQRRQFGRAGEEEMPILEYPTHQLRLIPRLATTYAFHFAHRYMVERYLNKSQEDEREIEALAAGLKAVSTWHTTETLQECREATGGQGYLAANRLADLKADTDIFTTFEGDNYVLLQLVAKSQLSEFRSGFRDLNFFGMLNMFAKRAAHTLTEKNQIRIAESNDAGSLRALDFQLQAFRNRESERVWEVARTMKKLIDGGMDSFDAFLEVQPQLIDMAKAYVHRIVLEQFAAEIDKAEDVEVKAVLEKLRALYALNELAEDRAWFMEQGYWSGERAEAVKRQVLALSRELKTEVLGLTEAFGIPDALLGAPMIIKK
ncbi:MAG: acyl-CoA dehydrogenase [Bacteroidota bacterium]